MNVVSGIVPAEYPIIMTAESVLAVTRGSMRQTRRIITPHPHRVNPRTHRPERRIGDTRYFQPINCPFGVAGDVLWVRETVYRDPYSSRLIYQDAVDDGLVDPDGWQIISPIHMPRSASRLRLIVERVRAERLQQITDRDAMVEGITADHVEAIQQDRMPFRVSARRGHPAAPVHHTVVTPRMVYAMYWNARIAQKGHTWDDNPFVWVITFALG